MVQARKGQAVLSVLRREGAGPAARGARPTQFLDGIADEDPEEPPLAIEVAGGAVREDEPLFRARLIGIGYDPERHLVLIELREEAVDDDDETPPPLDESEGHVARLYATRAQIRAMARNGVAAVEAGRPKCTAVRLPDGSRRAHLSALELDGVARGRRARRPNCCATATSRSSGACRGRRTRRSSCASLEATTRCSRSTSRSAASGRSGTSRAARCVIASSRPSRCRRRWGGRSCPTRCCATAPHGLGMMQRFVEHDPEQHYFTLLEEHDDAFRRMAAFDVVINNTDRKGGHCLARQRRRPHLRHRSRRQSFHTQWKLRTVIWEFGGESIPPDVCGDLHRLLDDMRRGPLARSRSHRCSTASSSTRCRPASSTCSRRACSPRPTATTTPTPGPRSNDADRPNDG